MASFPFPASARLHRREEFSELQAHGVRESAPGFTIIALARPARTRARLGCAISRRVGGAVSRNRIRRLLREAFRRAAPELPAVDVVVVAKVDAMAVAAGGVLAVERVVLPAIERATRRALAKKSDVTRPSAARPSP